MKTSFKLLVLLTILTLTSCTKEGTTEPTCECTRTVYKTQQYTVVQNGLPSLRTRRVMLRVERGIGCQPEGIVSGGAGLSYETMCTNY